MLTPGRQSTTAPLGLPMATLPITLPDIDGKEATRRIKSELTTQRIPIIAPTAHAMSSDREKAIAAGCDDFDTKPVDMSRLLAKIAALKAL